VIHHHQHSLKTIPVLARQFKRQFRKGGKQTASLPSQIYSNTRERWSDSSLTLELKPRESGGVINESYRPIKSKVINTNNWTADRKCLKLTAYRGSPGAAGCADALSNPNHALPKSNTDELIVPTTCASSDPEEMQPNFPAPEYAAKPSGHPLE
jgi:hypothetical protein